MSNFFGQIFSTLDISKIKSKAKFIMLFGLFAFCTRIICDIAIIQINLQLGVLIYAWNFLSALLIIPSLYYATKFKLENLYEKSNALNLFFMQFIAIFLALTVNILSSYLFFPLVYAFLETNLTLNKVIDDVFAVFYILQAIFIFHFFKQWMITHRHKHTKTLINLITYGLILLLILNLFALATNHKFQTGIDNISSFIYLLLAILSLYISNKNSWIAKLKKSDKFKLIWLSIFSVFCASISYSISTDSQSFIYLSVQNFLPVSPTLLSFVYWIFVFICLRIAFATILTLPTSEIVERTTGELNRLAEFNRVTRSMLDFNSLLDNVTENAYFAVQASAAWTEVYNPDGTISIISTRAILKENVNFIINQKLLTKRLNESEIPILIESVPEEEELAFILAANPNAKCLIGVPIFQGNDRIATLVLTHWDEYGFEKDDLEVLTAFSHNVYVALENTRLAQDSLQNEKYKRELMLAREMQNKLLPQNLPYLPNYSISAYSSPAEVVGGDYYDVLFLKNGKPCLLIGDVVGKGISAAFFMAQVKGVALSAAKNSESAKEILQKINLALYGANDKKIYVTMACIVINDYEGNVSIARAGHTPFIFRENKNKNSEIIIPKGIGISLAKPEIFDNCIEQLELKMGESSSLMMISDGVSELHNKDGIEFGYQRLQNIIDNNKLNPSDIIKHLTDELISYKDEMKQNDDITVLNLLYTGYDNANWENLDNG